MFIEFILWLVAFYILMSLAEYTLHRYTMHQRFFKHKKLAWIFEDHHISHHKHDDYTKNIDLPMWYHLVLSSPMIAILLIYSWIGLSAWLCIAFYHSYLWTKAHRAIHGLEDNWMTKWLFYYQIRDHHIKHHSHVNKNYGVCFFWCDRLFGTKI